MKSAKQEIPVRDFEGNCWEVEASETEVHVLRPLPSATETELFIASGLVDLQVNGFYGVNFSSAELTCEQIEYTTHQLWRDGIRGYLPTLITNSFSEISRILSIFQQVTDPICKKMILGFHLEGPFISPEDGPRGAHSRSYISAPRIDWLKEWQQIAQGQIKIITLSPHWQETEDFIKYCTSQSIRVAIGHTHASEQEIHNASSWGATLATHLGNGCHGMIHRHHNYIWAQLADDNLWISCIADGFHLPIDLLQIFFRAKSGKILLVSDTTSFKGLPSGEYSTHIGGEVVLTENGKLHIRNKPDLLAGSAQSLLDCVNFLHQQGIEEIADIWTKASLAPLQYLSRGIAKVPDIILKKENNNFILYA